MSEIKKGDLVMLVRPQPCCGSSAELGKIFTVADIFLSKAHKCAQCGYVTASVVALHGHIKDGLPVGSLLSRLKKIEPPTDQMRREEGLINKVEA
jgi:hypothetical protein